MSDRYGTLYFVKVNPENAMWAKLYRAEDCKMVVDDWALWIDVPTSVEHVAAAIDAFARRAGLRVTREHADQEGWYVGELALTPQRIEFEQLMQKLGYRVKEWTGEGGGGFSATIRPIDQSTYPSIEDETLAQCHPRPLITGFPSG